MRINMRCLAEIHQVCEWHFSSSCLIRLFYEFALVVAAAAAAASFFVFILVFIEQIDLATPEIRGQNSEIAFHVMPRHAMPCHTIEHCTDTNCAFCARCVCLCVCFCVYYA